MTFKKKKKLIVKEVISILNWALLKEDTIKPSPGKPRPLMSPGLTLLSSFSIFLLNQNLGYRVVKWTPSPIFLKSGRRLTHG
jgi:hypothetical protein